MLKAISNTSPLIYLYRGGVFEWLPELFSETCVPNSVVFELEEGKQKGYEVLDPREYEWLKISDPKVVPSEWLSLDFGSGELSAMALGLVNPDRILLMDDAMARRIAQAAGLKVWGTLKILIEAKNKGLVDRIYPLIQRFEKKVCGFRKIFEIVC